MRHAATPLDSHDSRWTATRARLNLDDLDMQLGNMQLGSFTLPPSDQP